MDFTLILLRDMTIQVALSLFMVDGLVLFPPLLKHYLNSFFKKLGFSKDTLHYTMQNAESDKPFSLIRGFKVLFISTSLIKLFL
jgi:hypothetical protein